MSSLIDIGVISLRYLGFLLIFFPIYIYKKVKIEISMKNFVGIFALIGF